LELLATYKELAPYVETINGRMIINEDKKVNGQTSSDVLEEYGQNALRE
jgi:hypothetical protein